MHAIVGGECGMYAVVEQNRRLLLKARDPGASCGVVWMTRDLENIQLLISRELSLNSEVMTDLSSVMIHCCIILMQRFS